MAISLNTVIEMPVMNPSEFDPRHLSFSQAQGFAELPHPLKLGELDGPARNRLWSVLYSYMMKSKRYVSWMAGPGHHPPYLDDPWREIFSHLHVNLYHLPLDEFSAEFSSLINMYKSIFVQPGRPLNQVFDVLQEMMRHRFCPREFTRDISVAFSKCQLAYIVNETDPVTILPAATSQEGRTITRALKDLDEAGGAGAAHLRRASTCVTKADWSGAVRESIHAVEFVARWIAPTSARTLKDALVECEKRNILHLHKAMRGALVQLYGYTSDEQGIRHSLLDEPEANVGQDEAVFMLGACAAFCSYLLRKRRAPSS